MRKLLALSTLAVSLSSVSALAADAGQTQFSLGGGLNINMIDTEDDLGDWEEESSASLLVAAKVEHGLNEGLSLRTGLWLQEKTAKISLDEGGIDGSLSINTIYASIPLNLQYKVHEKISIFGGYVADFRINDYCSVDGDFDTCTLDDDTESVVHGAIVGASIWGNDKLQVDVSYQHGISDVYDDGYKIHTLSAALFYKF